MRAMGDLRRVLSGSRMVRDMSVLLGNGVDDAWPVCRWAGVVRVSCGDKVPVMRVARVVRLSSRSSRRPS